MSISYTHTHDHVLVPNLDSFSAIKMAYGDEGTSMKLDIRPLDKEWDYLSPRLDMLGVWTHVAVSVSSFSSLIHWDADDE